MKITTLCGSIRQDSSNQLILKAIQSLFPKSTEWINFDIASLPYFDPQLQFGDETPNGVIALRKDIYQSDFLLIATPEYAHGIPGILKNALEWLVCEETMKKKVVVFIGAPSGGDFVKEYLLETLKTMDMDVAYERTLVLREIRNQISTAGEIQDLNLHDILVKFIAPLLK